MADIKRLFSRFIEKVGISPKATVQTARAELLDETRALRAHLRHTNSSYEQLLSQWQDALQNDTDDELAKKAPQLQADLLAARRTLYRSSITQQSKQELIAELQEWKKHQELLKAQGNGLADERIEMIESELALREPKRYFPESSIEQEPTSDIIVDTVQRTMPEEIVIEKGHPLEQWRQLQPQSEQVIETWSILLQKAHQEEMDPVLAASLMKEFKQSQAIIKQQDRRNRVTRYRINVFDGI